MSSWVIVTLNIAHTGTIPLSFGSHSFPLRNVFVPFLNKNLLSVAKFTRDNLVYFIFYPTGYQIYDSRTCSLLFQGPHKHSLYPLSFGSPQVLAAFSSTTWHNRLGHPSSMVLSRISPSLGSSFPSNKQFFCKGCALGKSTQLPFPSNTIHVSIPFYLVNSDVWMSLVPSISGFRYYVLFTDDYTRYSWIYPMRKKSEVFTHFQTFLAVVKNIFNSTVKYFQSDGGTEYVNISFSTLCHQLGIHHRLSCPHTPQQNGLAECKHCHIADMTHTLLSTSHAPLNLWIEAALTYVYLINILPTPIFNWSTPFSLLHNHPPSYSHLRTFGCACFPHLGPYVTNKLMSHSLECVFLGYSLQHKGYR